MDNSFLKEQADRCRRLAENADQFTRRRLLDLAEKYEDRLGGVDTYRIHKMIAARVTTAR
jgi:hypothetical protein